MSVAAIHSRKFYEQAVSGGRVFTFLDEGSLLVYPVGGAEVIPFWSSQSRLTTIQAGLAKYRAYQIDEIPFRRFYEEVLKNLEGEGVLVGVNWSGIHLTGYNLPVRVVRQNLDYWIAKEERT